MSVDGAPVDTRPTATPGCSAPTPRRGGWIARRCCSSAPARGRCSSRSPTRWSPPASPSTPTSGPILAPPGWDAAQLPADRLWLDAERARRDPPPQRAAPRGSPATRLRRARDPALALWVHATLVDSTIAANDAWAGPAVARRGGAVLRGDEADRAGVRRDRSAAAGRPRCVRGVPRRHARPGRPGPGRRRPPATSPRRSSIRRCPDRWRRAGIHPRLYAWTLWPSIGLLPDGGPRGVRLPLGTHRTGGRPRGS